MAAIQHVQLSAEIPVTWVKVDDGLPEHPKFLALSHRAARLWLHASCWASRRLTDGVIPYSAMPILLPLDKKPARQSAADELVAAGIFHVDGDGWRIHDFLDYNPSRAKTVTKRKQNADRLRRWREKAEAERNARETALHDAPKRDRNAVRNAHVTPIQDDHPRPDPDPQVKTETYTSDRSPSDGRALWTRIIEELEISETNRKEFFDPCEVYSYEPGRLTINARKTFIGEWLNTHFWKRVREVAAAIEPGVRVDLITKPLSVRVS